MRKYRASMRASCTVAFCAAVLLFSPCVQAQVTTATLQGIVYDPSGAVIPGTEISLTSDATGQELTTSTSEGGEFAISFIQPGSYSIVLTADGFKATSVEGLQLASGQRANINYTLEVGATTETVTVTGAAPLMNTVNAEQDISLNETQVDELPMINRDITGILSLGTGAAIVGGWTMSINGLAPRGFTMTVDAVDAVPDAEFAALALYQNFNFIKGISLEAVAEVETSKNIFSAETGNTIAGNINLISKSGTNSLHGSLFEMYQSGGLHARNHIVGIKSPLVYHHYGASLGGPIIPNKTFYFGVFEGYRFNRLSPVSGEVWSRAMRQRIGQAVPAAQAYLDLFPEPSEPDGPNLDPSDSTCGDLPVNTPCVPAVAFFGGVGTENRRDDHAVIKVDHQVGSNNFLTFRYVRSRPLRQIPRLALGNWRQWDGIQENGAFTLTRIINPTMTSETRWGTNVNAINRLDGAYAANEIPFLSGFGGPGGGAEVFAKDGHTSTLEQTLAKTSGRHVIKFGGMFRYMSGTRINEEVPIYQYNTQADLLAGRIEAARYVFPLEKFTWKRWFGGVFVQDDIRLKPNLMVNLGLRWDYASVPRSHQNAGGMPNIFNRNGPFGLPGATLRTELGKQLLFRRQNRFWDAIYNMWSPRLGFAWTLDDQGKTVVRGGAGIFHMPHNIFAGPIDTMSNGPDLPSHLNVVGAANVSNLGIQYGDPNEVGAQLASAGAVIGGNSVDPGWAAPYSAQFTLGIQRQVTDDTVWDISFVGNRGVHLIFNPTYNRLLPYTDGSLYSQVLGLEDFARFNLYQGGDSTGYHSLQTSLKRRFSRNLQLNMNYTYAWNWAHFRGDMTCCTGGNDPQTVWSPSRAALYDLKNNRSPTHYHIRHRFTTDFYYEVPTPGGASSGLRHLLGGWSLAGIFEAASGTPLRITQGGTQSPGQRPDFVGPEHGAAIRPDWGSSNQGRYQYLNIDMFQSVETDAHDIALRPGTLSRYALYGPGLWNLDAAIVKRIEVKEGQNLQLRVDLFNALNHTVLGGIQTNSVSGTFGRLRSSRDGRKVQLTARFDF